MAWSSTLSSRLLPSGCSTWRTKEKAKTGSMPEETLSASSEIVPVGAMEFRSELRMP